MRRNGLRGAGLLGYLRAASRLAVGDLWSWAEEFGDPGLSRVRRSS